MSNNNNTFSSIKEALQSGILERRRASVDNGTTARGGSVMRGSNGRRAGSALSQSFTSTGITAGTRIHRADTRSSFASIAENCRDGDDTTIITIETLRLSGSPPPEELDLSVMTDEDLKRLKREDPFMYYSIPEVHQRAYRLEDDEDAAGSMVPLTIYGGNPQYYDEVSSRSSFGRLRHDDDTSSGAGPPAPRVAGGGGRCPQFRPPSLASSCPAGMLANAEMARASLLQSSSVMKRRRISVEAHPTLICEEMMRRASADISEMDDNNEDEDLLSLEESFLESLLLGGALRRGGESDDDEDSEDEY